MLAFSLVTKQRYADTFLILALKKQSCLSGNALKLFTELAPKPCYQTKSDFEFLFYGYLIILRKDTTGDLGVSFLHCKVQ